MSTMMISGEADVRGQMSGGANVRSRWRHDQAPLVNDASLARILRLNGDAAQLD